MESTTLSRKPQVPRGKPPRQRTEKYVIFTKRQLGNIHIMWRLPRSAPTPPRYFDSLQGVKTSEEMGSRGCPTPPPPPAMLPRSPESAPGGALPTGAGTLCMTLPLAGGNAGPAVWVVAACDIRGCGADCKSTASSISPTVCRCLICEPRADVMWESDCWERGGRAFWPCDVD